MATFDEALAEERRKFERDPEGYARRMTMKYNPDADLASRIDEIHDTIKNRLNVQSQVIEETRKELSDLRSGG